jgi:phosphoglycerol transferase
VLVVWLFVLIYFLTPFSKVNVKIEGNKLGLGVNLFSKEKTLVEKLGYEKVEKELLKKSNYYNKLVKEK